MSNISNEDWIKSATNTAADPLSPVGKDCVICGVEYEDEEWGLMGWMGMIPVSMCPICTNGIYELVLSSTPAEELEQAAIMRRMEDE